MALLVDHACASARDATVFLDLGAKALSVKPGRIGLTESWTVARRSAERGAQTIVGLFGESMLGALHELSFAAAKPDRSMPAEICFLTLREQLLTAPLAIRAGRIELPAEPGFAQCLDRDRLQRFTVSNG